MIYNDKRINIYGISRLEQSLLSNEQIHISSLDEDEARYANAFEHYLVKIKMNPSSRDNVNKAVEKRLESLLQAFEKNPTLINVSYILGTESVAKKVFIAPGQQQRYQSLIDRLENYWRPIYNKVMAGETISDREKNLMYSYFNYKMKFGKNLTGEYAMLKSCMDNIAFKILSKNEIPTNKTEKLFIYKYASKFTAYLSGFGDEVIDIHLIDFKYQKDGGFTGGYELEGYIAINENLYKGNNGGVNFHNSLDTILQTVCHETTHRMQELQAESSPDNEHGMEMAIHQLFGSKEYKTGMNYLFNEIEENAQLNGYFQASVLYGMAKNDVISHKLMDERRMYHEGRKFQYEYVTYTNPKTNQQEKTLKENFNVENIRKVIKDNPNLIREYPSLVHLFSLDGNPKGIKDILTSDFESHSIEKMYEDTILYELRNGNVEKIDTSMLTDRQKHNMFKKLSKILYREMDYIFDIYKDGNLRKRNPMAIKCFEEHLKYFARISKIYENELTWMRKYENQLTKENKPNRGLYTDFNTNMRSFINMTSKTEGIEDLMPVLNKASNIVNRIENKMKDQYIDYVLEHFTNEELRLPVVSNRGYVTLEEFIKTDLREVTDLDHYVHDNKGNIMYDVDGKYLSPLRYVKQRLEFTREYVSQRQQRNESNYNDVTSVIPSFQETKNLNKKYAFIEDGNIIDKDTGRIIDASSRIKFALAWRQAANVYTQISDNIDQEYAFNESAGRLYNQIVYIIANQIKQNGEVDENTIYQIISDSQYKHTKTVVDNMFKNEFMKEHILEIFEENFGQNRGQTSGRK